MREYSSLEKSYVKQCLSQSGKLRCYATKTAISSNFYKYLDREEALNMNFIPVGNDFFIPAIIMDFDNVSIYELMDKIDTFGIRPTFVVDTDRGYHVWWVLNNSIYTKNEKQLNYYKSILTKMADFFGCDANALMKYTGGRIWRNPLTHDTVFYDRKYSLQDLQYALEEYEIETRIKEVRRMKRQTARTKKEEVARKAKNFEGSIIPPSEVEVGYRNATLVNNLGVFLRSLYKKTGEVPGETAALAYARDFNNALSEPLEKAEVEATVRSMVKRFNPSKSCSDTRIKYNREAKKFHIKKNIVKASKRLYAHYIKKFGRCQVNMDFFRKMKQKEFAELFQVSMGTAHNWKKNEKILEEILIGFSELLSALVSGGKITEDFMKLLESIKLFQDWFKKQYAILYRFCQLPKTPPKKVVCNTS
jgi:DNA-binding transcriptional regulator YiaG